MKTRGSHLPVRSGCGFGAPECLDTRSSFQLLVRRRTKETRVQTALRAAGVRTAVMSANRPSADLWHNPPPWGNDSSPVPHGLPVNHTFVWSTTFFSSKHHAIAESIRFRCRPSNVKEIRRTMAAAFLRPDVNSAQRHKLVHHLYMQCATTCVVVVEPDAMRRSMTGQHPGELRPAVGSQCTARDPCGQATPPVRRPWWSG